MAYIAMDFCSETINCSESTSHREGEFLRCTSDCKTTCFRGPKLFPLIHVWPFRAINRRVWASQTCIARLGELSESIGVSPPASKAQLQSSRLNSMQLRRDFHAKPWSVSSNKGSERTKTKFSVANYLLDPKNPHEKMWVTFLFSFPGHEAHKFFRAVPNPPELPRGQGGPSLCVCVCVRACSFLFSWGLSCAGVQLWLGLGLSDLKMHLHIRCLSFKVSLTLRQSQRCVLPFHANDVCSSNVLMPSWLIICHVRHAWHPLSVGYCVLLTTCLNKRRPFSDKTVRLIHTGGRSRGPLLWKLHVMMWELKGVFSRHISRRWPITLTNTNKWDSARVFLCNHGMKPAQKAIYIWRRPRFSAYV